MIKLNLIHEPIKHKLTRMSGKGDEVVAEWLETDSPESLEKVEEEFNQLMAKGYFAADLKTNELVKEFDPNTDTLMIPHMSGGSR